MDKKAKDHFEDLIKIMKRLRQECPWDRKQTHESLRQYLLEESYEVIESIDNNHYGELSRELGDLLLQIVFHSAIAEEEKIFSIKDVIKHINNKLIERHPHIFSDVKVDNADQVEQNWEHIKIKSENRKSLLDGIPASAPALLYAQRMQEKASRVGFDWSDKKDVLLKIEEELNELKTAVAQNDHTATSEEIGDLIFAIVNFARFNEIASEDALRFSNNKFKKRFQYIENHFNNDINLMKKSTLQELDDLWEKAKKEIN